MIRLPRHLFVAPAVSLFATSAFAQVVWDGNSDPNNSGLWSDAANWSGDAIPSATAVELNDVTSGNRLVTYDDTVSSNSITSLAITQTTAGSTNGLVVTGTGLTLTGATNVLALSGSDTSLSVSNATVSLSSTSTKSATSDGTITLGDASVNGNIYATGAGAFNFTNNGTLTVNRQSSFGVNVSSGASKPTFTNNGTVNLVGDATGVRLGTIDVASNSSGMDPLFNNSGVVNVKVLAGAGTGLTRYGLLDTGSQARGATFANNAGGVMNVDADATFRMVGRRATDSSADFLLQYTNDVGAVLNVGNAASSTTGGTVDYVYTLRTGTGNTAQLVRFANAGTANLYGTSAIRISSSSTPGGDGGSIAVTNSGVLNLHDSSTVGSSARGTFLVNSGTINKIGSGTAGILAATTGAFASTGTYSNTGLIYVQEGSLVLTRSLDSSAATSAIKFDLNGAGAVDPLLNTGGLTLGDSTGATLALNITAAIVNPAVYNLIDGDITGQFTTIEITGIGISGTETFTGSPTSWSISNGVTFELDYATGTLTVVPEPSTVAMLGLAGFGAVLWMRRRRQG